MRHTRFISVERLERIAKEALLGGYAHVDTWRDGGYRRVVVLDIKHNCTQPYGYELHARYSATHAKSVKPLVVRGTARCRKCEKCMHHRANQWRQRAVAEYATWPVTCFGTLTLRPEEHYRFDAMLEAGDRDRPAVRLRDLSAHECFAARVGMIGTEITNWIKRLRKGDKDHRRPRLRYLIVAEMHDGARTSEEMRHRPHFHVMLHEMKSSSLFSGSPIRAMIDAADGEWVRKSVQSENGEWRPGVFLKDDAFVRTQWTLGHTKFQFAESEKAAWYLCKYLTKTLDCRVRASQAYGVLEKEPIRLNPSFQSLKQQVVVQENLEHRSGAERASGQD